MTTTRVTSPNQGQGILSATAVNSRDGIAEGGRYLISGAGALTGTAWARGVSGADGATSGAGHLRNLNNRAVLHGRGALAAPVYTQITFFPVTGYFNAITDPSVTTTVNQPPVSPISALVTFTPRLERGQMLFMSSYLVTNAYNALQTLFLIGNPNSGTWTVAFGDDTTDALAWDISPADLQTALEGLTSIGSGNVTVVVGASPLSYNVEFTNALGIQLLPPLVGDGDELVNAVGPGNCEVTTAVTALGSPQVVANSAIAIPTLTARIWNGVLSTINIADTPGFQLPANTGPLNIDGDLIYDVQFSNITFNGVNQFLAPFAFTAPCDDTPICLTDPALEKLPYQIPSATTWTPALAPSQPMALSMLPGGRRSWRQRAG